MGMFSFQAAFIVEKYKIQMAVSVWFNIHRSFARMTISVDVKWYA